MLYKIIVAHGNLIEKSSYLSYVKIEETGGEWHQELVHHKIIEVGLSGTIQSILQTPIIAYNTLNINVNLKIAEAIKEFIVEYDLEHKIDLVGLEGLKISDDLLMCEPAVIAASLSLPVIAEFEKINKVLNGNNQYLEMALELFNIDPHTNSENRSIAIALMAVLRWRETCNVFEKHTHATKNHIGGSLWLGTEA